MPATEVAGSPMSKQNTAPISLSVPVPSHAAAAARGAGPGAADADNSTASGAGDAGTAAAEAGARHGRPRRDMGPEQRREGSTAMSARSAGERPVTSVAQLDMLHGMTTLGWHCSSAPQPPRRVRADKQHPHVKRQALALPLPCQHKRRQRQGKPRDGLRREGIAGTPSVGQLCRTTQRTSRTTEVTKRGHTQRYQSGHDAPRFFWKCKIE